MTDDIITSKTCSKCKMMLPASSFAKRPDRPVGLQSRCRSCISGDRRLAYAERRRHGMSRADRERLLDEQEGLCLVCEEEIPPDGRGWMRGAVDHDHSCCPGSESCGGCVRGILCKNCNFAIGLMNDSAERLRSAADYLEGVRR